GTDELLVPGRARRRVEAPGVAVRDDERVEAPLRELLEELARGVRRLGAVLGKLAGVDAGGAERDGGELVLEGPEVEVTLAVLEVEEREAKPLPEGRALAEGADQALVERADRPARPPVLGGVVQADG